MLCEKCKRDFSPTVYPLHIERCQEGQEEATAQSDAEIREKAAELGVKNVKNKKIETLLADIAEIEADNELKALRERADELLIDDIDTKDAETLKAEIAVAEADQ